MPKKFIKSKSFPNSPGPGYRTASSFRSSKFGKGSVPMKFNAGQFRTQHKGG